MRLLKIVAIPAAISLLLTPADATEAKARSKILGKIQKNVLAQGKAAIAQAEQCIDCDTACHEKFEHTNGECPHGDQYNPDDYTDYTYPQFDKLNVNI